jgi:hypothetical protein
MPADDLESLGSAIGLVAELTGWDWGRAHSWLTVQVALGRINPEMHVVSDDSPIRVAFYRLSEVRTACPAAPALPPKRVRLTEVRAWLAARYDAGAVPTERADVDAARQKFPGITRRIVREERHKLLGREQLRRGPRRNCAEKLNGTIRHNSG